MTPPLTCSVQLYNCTCTNTTSLKFTCGYATCTPSAERLEARSWEPRYSCTSRTWQPISGANEDPSSPFLRQPWLLSPQLLLRSLFSGASNSETLATRTARDRTRSAGHGLARCLSQNHKTGQIRTIPLRGVWPTAQVLPRPLKSRR